MGSRFRRAVHFHPGVKTVFIPARLPPTTTMAGRTGARVLALPPETVLERPVATLHDIGATLEPDAVWVLGRSREPTAAARARHAIDAPVIHPPLETGGDALSRRPIGDDGLAFAVARSASALRAGDGIRSASDQNEDEREVDALICDDIATTTRPTALETTLDHAAELAAALPTGRTTTVLTGGLPAGYDERWHVAAETGTVRTVEHDPLRSSDSVADDCVAVRVRGAGPVDGYGGPNAVVELEFTADGLVSSTAHAASDFGLEAISGIGPKTAGRLAECGVTTRSELLETPVAALADIEGIGPKSARRMHQHATVLETGEPRRVGNASLPGENWSTPPLCIDIETDGLSPTIIWQIGVYDPSTDTYRAFVERDDPADRASVLQAFCDWLLGVHPNRALLTWNGWGFDYRHLGAFVARHCPAYAAEWESIPKFDLYLWADGDDNALLPGRTNELDVVAAELGYDGAATGLDGARTAAAYQRFMRTGDGSELEWDRHEAYCEDDCRALWHVYERLRDAPQVSAGSSASGAASSSSTAEQASGEQTGLGDF